MIATTRWVLLLSGLALAGCSPARVDRVVLVTIDTLRADRVGAYGDTQALTPALDSVAREGVRFDAAITPTPLTLPSHASLLTGLAPPAHGVRGNSGFVLPPDVGTLTGSLKQAGFATAAFVGAVVLAERYGLARGFDVYGDQMGRRRRHVRTAFAERPADAVVDEAIAWLQTAPARFFLWVHLYDPHAEYVWHEQYRDRVPDAYRSEIAFADSQVGRLLAAVRERGGNDGLLVVITSDHGEGLGEHGEQTHGLGLYESTQRVPLVMSGPGLDAGRSVKALARVVDVAPTILASAGAAPLPRIDGRDLGELARGSDAPLDPAYLETLATALDWGWSPLYGLRTQRYKLVRAPKPELYDLEVDPRELENLFETRAELAADLQQKLDARLRAASLWSVTAMDPAELARIRSLGYAGERPPDQAPPLGEVSGANPRDQMALADAWRQATELTETGRAKQAQTLLLPYAGRSPMLDRALAVASLRALDLATAEATASALVETRPDDVSAHLVLGHVYYVQDRDAEARQSFERALALEPELSEALTFLGRVAEGQSQRAEAVAYYERAITADPNTIEPVWRLAAMRLEAGDDGAATELLAGLPPESLGRVAPAVRLARAELGTGRGEQALARLHAAARGAPASQLVMLEYERSLREVAASEPAVAVREAPRALEAGEEALPTASRAGPASERRVRALIATARAIIEQTPP